MYHVFIYKCIYLTTLLMCDRMWRVSGNKTYEGQNNCQKVGKWMNRNRACMCGTCWKIRDKLALKRRPEPKI